MNYLERRHSAVIWLSVCSCAWACECARSQKEHEWDVCLIKYINIIQYARNEIYLGNMFLKHFVLLLLCLRAMQNRSAPRKRRATSDKNSWVFVLENETQESREAITYHNSTPHNRENNFFSLNIDSTLSLGNRNELCKQCPALIRNRNQN